MADALISGAFDVATFGMGRIVKLGKYGRRAWKFGAPILKNTLSAHVDWKGGEGLSFFEKTDGKIQADLWAGVATDMLLGKGYDFALDNIVPKKIIGDLTNVTKWSDAMDVVKNWATKSVLSIPIAGFKTNINDEIMMRTNAGIGYDYNWNKRGWYER